MAVLGTEDHSRMMAEYDRWLADANKPAPTPLTLTGTQEQRQQIMQRNREAYQAWASNPGRKILDGVRAELTSMSYDLSTAEGQEALRQNLAAKRAAYEEGLSRGKSGDFGVALQKLFSLDIAGAIKEGIKAIPFVGDFLLVPAKMLNRLTTGKFLGPIEAFKEARQERAVSGALSAIGINDPAEMGRITSIAIEDSKKPAAATTATPVPAPAPTPAPVPAPVRAELRERVVTVAFKAGTTELAPELAEVMTFDTGNALKAVLTPGKSVMMAKSAGGAMGFYVGRREGSEFIVEELVMVTPDAADPQKATLKRVDTGLKDRRLPLTGDTVTDNKPMSDDLEAAREDGRLVNVAAEMERSKSALTASALRWEKEVLGRAEDAARPRADAKATAMMAGPAGEKPAEGINRLRAAVARSARIAGAGVELRQAFDRKQKLVMGLDPAAPVPAEKKGDMDRAWEEFKASLAARTPPVNLDDIDRLAADPAAVDTLTRLRDELTAQAQAQQSRNDIRAMAQRAPARVSTGAALDSDTTISAAAKTMLKASGIDRDKKFIVVTEGDRTMVYIGKDETTGADAAIKTGLKVEKAMELKDGVFVEQPAIKDSFFSYEAGKTDTLTADALAAARRQIRDNMGTVDAEVAPPRREGLAPVPADSFFGIDVQAFVDAALAAERRFPPQSNRTAVADAGKPAIEVPTVPDMSGRTIGKA